MEENMYTIDRNAIGRPYPLGVTIENNRTYFSVAMKSEMECETFCTIKM
ncbi:hypothetical protein [Kineothrix sp. MB12-C1]|nr:hypothetical protein [Kineothrix sp. MB12-C1]WMC92745.1 hypothetical protein RBB56_00210 [Kineothrix sp. MB12-C1]